ncbi:unnamed protein product [Prorocentrum cordatum]|uniref:C-type lectin domain-containing protein n=1 Tax=Prorocentrum cordatum TaxID=2364126 RepID=A0ABN9U7G6_9DINO|nr:unnamed protein product [Polarella glacialis]
MMLWRVGSPGATISLRRVSRRGQLVQFANTGVRLTWDQCAQYCAELSPQGGVVSLRSLAVTAFVLENALTAEQTRASKTEEGIAWWYRDFWIALRKVRVPNVTALTNGKGRPGADARGADQCSSSTGRAESTSCAEEESLDARWLWQPPPVPAASVHDTIVLWDHWKPGRPADNAEPGALFECAAATVLRDGMWGDLPCSEFAREGDEISQRVLVDGAEEGGGARLPAGFFPGWDFRLPCICERWLKSSG